jgi:hypothetical protein
MTEGCDHICLEIVPFQEKLLVGHRVKSEKTNYKFLFCVFEILNAIATFEICVVKVFASQICSHIYAPKALQKCSKARQC